MLNKHNNSYWYELLAKSTLQVVFPEEFKALKSSDKPDLIDTSLKMGIEVIHPVDERQMQLDSFYQKFLSGKTIAEVSEKGLSRFRENLYDIMIDKNDGTIYAYKKPYQEFNIELLYEAIEKKAKKLNESQYLYSTNASLYLEMAMCSLESMHCSVAEKILDYAINQQNQYPLFYKEIFYDCIMALYRINLVTRTITKYDISDLADSIDVKFKENQNHIAE